MGPAPGTQVELLGVDAGVRAESSVETSPNGRRWLGLTALALAAVIGWVAFGPSGDEEAAEATTTTEPSTTTAPEAATTTTTVRPTTRPPTTVVVDGGGPLLGEPTGLALLTTGFRFQLVDLDTGEVHDVPGSLDYAIGVVGPYALGQSFNNDLFSLDLRTGERVSLGTTISDALSIDAPEGQAWFMDRTADATVVRRIDLSTGVVVEEVAVPVEIGYVDSSLRWASPASGGVYEVWGLDQPRRVVDGGAVAVLGDLVLVETCDDALRCTERWYDGAAGRWRDDLATPGAPGASCHGAGLRLLCWRWYADTDESFVFSPATGERIDLPRDTWSTDLSPDGRWLSSAWDSSVLILDLETGDTIQLDHAGLSGVNQAYFVRYEDLS